MAKGTSYNHGDHIDPTDIAGINERAFGWAAGHETIHPVPIDELTIADDAIDTLVEAVRSRASGGVTMMVVDRTPMRRGGDDLKLLIEETLRRAVPLTVRRLPDQPGAPFHAELETARQLADELAGYGAVISVGSGSITDTVKYARHLSVQEARRKLPFVSFPTAASVTAYTSALAALTIAGVKRTLPASPPNAVICDSRTLNDAPRIMTQAGFGDVLARGVSYADWYLASQIGMDNTFSQVPSRLLETAEHEMIARAEGVAAGDRDALRAVTEAVLLAGMAMSLIGQTAPLSGWEHALGHFLDLSAAHDGRKPAVHGGQVGVGTLISARAYERAWNELDLKRLTVDQDDGVYREAIEGACRRYDTRGTLIAEIWRDFERKLTRWRAAGSARRAFAERHRTGELDESLRQVLLPAAQINDALRRAGAPRRFADLNEPIRRSSAHAAVRYAHLTRSRFTLGDLLSETGWLNEARVPQLLDEPAEGPTV
jgi:glycerol-1-phosphate dehydrogenase [NAD(P)+]